MKGAHEQECTRERDNDKTKRRVHKTKNWQND